MHRKKEGHENTIVDIKSYKAHELQRKKQVEQNRFDKMYVESMKVGELNGFVGCQSYVRDNCYIRHVMHRNYAVHVSSKPRTVVIYLKSLNPVHLL